MNKTTTKISVTTGGLNFVTLLTLVFIVLKMTGYIDWSWWWVFSPMIITAVAGVLVIIIALIVLFGVTVFRK